MIDSQAIPSNHAIGSSKLLCVALLSRIVSGRRFHMPWQLSQLFFSTYVDAVLVNFIHEVPVEAKSPVKLSMPICLSTSEVHAHCKPNLALESELEKVSPSLGRSAVYLKESRINKLPRYDPTLKAVVVTCTEELAYKQAKEADNLLQKGVYLGNSSNPSTQKLDDFGIWDLVIWGPPYRLAFHELVLVVIAAVAIPSGIEQLVTNALDIWCVFLAVYSMRRVGGLTCVLISVGVCPVWAGEELHNLVATNLEKLGEFLQGFGDEFFESKENDQKSDEIVSKDDKSFLQRYKSVLIQRLVKSNLLILRVGSPVTAASSFSIHGRSTWQ
ncbi:hypothetical protein Syun_006376 [Stephania yunnanensis]|uniref:Uncharacterized protein n=1 Tax=Stephania yunnanensis TaxID=152371 RepID=A0AAP0KZ40_9MAGN